MGIHKTMLLLLLLGLGLVLARVTALHLQEEEEQEGLLLPTDPQGPANPNDNDNDNDKGQMETFDSVLSLDLYSLVLKASDLATRSRLLRTCSTLTTTHGPPYVVPLQLLAYLGTQYTAFYGLARFYDGLWGALASIAAAFGPDDPLPSAPAVLSPDGSNRNSMLAAITAWKHDVGLLDFHKDDAVLSVPLLRFVQRLFHSSHSYHASLAMAPSFRALPRVFKGLVYRRLNGACGASAFSSGFLFQDIHTLGRLLAPDGRLVASLACRQLRAAAWLHSALMEGPIGTDPVQSSFSARRNTSVRRRAFSKLLRIYEHLLDNDVLDGHVHAQWRIFPLKSFEVIELALMAVEINVFKLLSTSIFTDEGIQHLLSFSFQELLLIFP